MSRTDVMLDGSSDAPGAWSVPVWSEEAAPFTAHDLFARTGGPGLPEVDLQEKRETTPEADERSSGTSHRRRPTPRRPS